MRALRYLTAVAAAALIAPAAALTAQPVALPAVRQAIALNPLALPFGGLSAEYEHVLGETGFAFGAGGTVALDSRFDLGSSDGDYTSLQGKLKYYPSERGLRGFAVGITAGLVHGRADVSDYDSGNGAFCPGNTFCSMSTSVSRRATAPTVGAVVDYNWVLGPRRRFIVGVGLGARRVLAGRADRDVLGDVLPDGRLVVGYGF